MKMLSRSALVSLSATVIVWILFNIQQDVEASPYCENDELISRDKTVTQSSLVHGGHPFLAIDGKYDQVFDYQTCTHTQTERNPWWKIDLGRQYNVKSVKVWNRADCCGDILNSLKIQTSDDDSDWREVGSLNEEGVNGGLYTIQTPGAVGRFVRLFLSSSQPVHLTLCEAEIYGCPTDTPPPSTPKSELISRGKTVTQSSLKHNGHPVLAIDGSYYQHFYSHSCTHTEKEKNPWWRIDLGRQHYVNSVRIWNREDCCGDRLNSLKIQTSDDGSDWQWIGSLNEEAKNGGVYTIQTPGAVGRFVRLILSKPQPEWLTLCEVEILGSPTDVPPPPPPPSPPKRGLISRGKRVTQSSVKHNGHPFLANDGNNDQNFYSQSCTHTEEEKNPWWTIDLGRQYNVKNVKVWNRADCCGFRLNSLKVQTSNDASYWREVGSLNEQAVNGGLYTIQTTGAVGRFFRLILSKSEPEYLTLCEVEVYGSPTDTPPPSTPKSELISRGKPVTQSSVKHNGHPLLAIDGIYNQNFHSQSCTHTDSDKNPWWRIDLGRQHYVNTVKIWNRADCCGERLNSLKIQTSVDGSDWKWVGSLNEEAKNGGVYTIQTLGAVGRFVRLILSKPQPEWLTLCEVEILGSPTDDGKW